METKVNHKRGVLKKLATILSIGVFSFVLFNSGGFQSTKAYDYNVGENVVNTYTFASQFTVIANDEVNSKLTVLKNSSTVTEFTLVFLDTAPILSYRFEILFGNDIATLDFSDPSYFSNYYRLDTPGTLTTDLHGMMFYVRDYNMLDSNVVSFRYSAGNFDLYTYLTSYSKVIYDSPTNILSKSINYYYQDGVDAGEGIGYDNGYTVGYDLGEDYGYGVGHDAGFAEGYDEGTAEGYQVGYSTGQIDMYNNGSLIYGLDVSNSFDYTKGQTDIYTNGSSTYGFIGANAFDYEIGYNEGTQENVNDGLATFSANFDKWIVPAILVVLLLGGYFAVRKAKDEQV